MMEDKKKPLAKDEDHFLPARNDDRATVEKPTDESNNNEDADFFRASLARGFDK